MANFYVIEKDKDGNQRSVGSAPSHNEAKKHMHELEKSYKKYSITGVVLYILDENGMSEFIRSKNGN